MVCTKDKQVTTLFNEYPKSVLPTICITAVFTFGWPDSMATPMLAFDSLC